MVDSHVTIGSCAQVGKHIHISASTQIGGVLEPAGALPLTEEMLVLAGLRPGQLDALLAALRQAKASVDLKAVLTEHNGQWSGRYLQSQLKKEREAMLAWRRGQGAGPAHQV